MSELGEWYVHELNGQHLICVNDANTFGGIGTVGVAYGKANAALIVTAVNAHDDLMASLREFVESELEDGDPEYFDMLIRAKVALAKGTP